MMAFSNEICIVYSRPRCQELLSEHEAVSPYKVMVCLRTCEDNAV